MSDELERLANGVLWPGFLGTTAPAWLRTELRRGLAGVVYFGQNMGEGIHELSADLRAANPDALIGIDEEGGSVTRIEAATGSTVPGAAQLGGLDDVAATRATGAELARRVRAIGADVLLGPVADVNTDPRNPVIGVRSFGADAELVSRHAVAEIEGIQGAGVAACVKHFPGHGDTHVDSHHDLPTVDLDPAEFERVHLAPFRAAVAAGVNAVMTAHIVVPAWGEEPATLNPHVLGMLRAEGFDGVIITDALDMAAIRESVGIGGGAVRALAAGADLLCIGNPTNPGDVALPDQDERDFLAARDAIVDALRDGSLSRARVAEAGARNARLSAKLRAAETGAASDARYGDESSDAAGYDAEAIVRRAVTARAALGAPARGLVVLDARRRSSLAVDSAGAYVAATLAGDGPRVRLDTARATEAERAAAIGEIVAVAEAEGVAEGESLRVVVLVDRIDTDERQRSLLDAVALAAPSAAVVNVGLPAEGAVGVLPILDVRAASRIGSAVARERLVGVTR
ncbi:beta-N-acetylhexosaminidase [Microbacterium resistens]|uniref:Beta-N-acetylhexosaminidase n=1 Tax=Microbacterium resistens TaxID=156977 RepID=A0ABU1SCK1_9MICO|nr:glycoside hydrolase family 3 N-terminal domain-containing protein [Microbacterium resistens]MDR6867342.1 beta-N-acetylhexosaminidase [Microbacterium resistens]